MRERLGSARVARLGTVTPTGQPHVVPLCFAMHGDEVYSVVDFKPKSTIDLARLENVRANPEITIVADHYDDDHWDRLWWVRADGDARILESGVEYANAIHHLRTKYPQYQVRRPTGPVLAMHVRRITGWSGRDSSTRSGFGLGFGARQPARNE